MNRICFSGVVLVFVLVLFATGGSCLAEEPNGWEEGGVYDALYEASELDRLKCTVEKVTEVVPMKGMSPGIALIVEDGDGEKIEVHVGPKSFLGDSVAIKRGDKLKIRGAWAEISGKEFFMAAKIKKGDFYELKVRLTKNGKPFWAMSPEELAHEKAQE